MKVQKKSIYSIETLITFNQFNVFLLNKSTNFFKKKWTFNSCV